MFLWLLCMSLVDHFLPFRSKLPEVTLPFFKPQPTPCIPRTRVLPLSIDLHRKTITTPAPTMRSHPVIIGFPGFQRGCSRRFSIEHGSEVGRGMITYLAGVRG
ncbi:hypothetical protein TNIN_77161 [Trichonephila inaurata madagascariensis]|uniref:Secreted protein n=1 Tax=Trichonephila inaurata madagascariensis TaxID=2747483 RepID=A0A8X6Y903_9ARAC|nr:hypothetical protein TNIN_77161 [Trichonephila inaurata madagascariensis]